MKVKTVSLSRLSKYTNFVIKAVAKLAGLYACYLGVVCLAIGIALVRSPGKHSFIHDPAELTLVVITAGLFLLAAGIFLIFKKMPDVC